MEPVAIGVAIIIVVVFSLVLAFLLFNKEQTFEDAVAQQIANNETLIESKGVAGKAVAKQRKKPKKFKNDNDLGHVKGSKEADHLPADVSVATSRDSDVHSEPTSSYQPDEVQTSPEKSSGNAESSEEERSAVKPAKKKPRDKKRRVVQSPNEDAVTQKEQEPAPREVVAEKPIVEDIIVKLESEPVYESAPEPVHSVKKSPKNDTIIAATKKSKKTRGAKEKSATPDEVDVDAIVATLENTNLDNNEIQKLVAILLDKQKSAQQWKTPGSKPDPLELLRRQLTEKEAAYEEERSRAEGLASKTKEIRDELNQEKLKKKNAENEAAQKIQGLMKENQALQLRMSASHNNHSQENQSLRTALEQCKKNHGQQEWRQLQEELTSTKELVHRTNQEKAELEAKLSSFEKDAGSNNGKESMLMKQMTEANERLASAETVKKSLSQQLQESVKGKSESEQKLDMVKKELQTAQASQADVVKQRDQFKSQLDTERTKKTEMEKMLKALESKHKEESEKSAKEKTDLVQKLDNATKSKNDDTQLADLQKHLAEVSQQLEDLRTQLAQAERDSDKTKQDLAASTEQLGKNEGEIKTLKQSNTNKDNEIESLKKQLAVQESEVMVVQATASEQLQAAPDFDDSRLTELEEEVEKLKGELNERNETIGKLEAASETMKAKNNELREKNWKVMEALSSAEKSRDGEIGKAVSSIKEENRKATEQQQSDIKAYLCTIHPNISVDKNMPYEKFLEEYEIQAKELGCVSPVDTAKVDELENKLSEFVKKTADLEEQCEKYKTTLASTENMLRELERNVEDEMTTLKESLKNKDSELKQSNASLTGLQEKVKKSDELSKTKDDRIATLENELTEKAKLLVDAGDSEKLSSTIEELKENLRKSEEDSKSKDSKINNLEKSISTKDSDVDKLKSSLKDVQDNLRKSEEDAQSKSSKISSLETQISTNKSDLEKANKCIGEMKEGSRKASDELKSKDGKISLLETELSSLKKSHEDSAKSSQNELKKLSENLEVIKKQEASLRTELEEAKKDAGKKEAAPPSVAEVEKSKREAEDASKVNADLRKELEEVRLQLGQLQTSSSSSSQKKKHKEDTDKIKALEEKLSLASKKENELTAKIASLEESKSMNSVDEDGSVSPDKKKKSKSFSLLGSSKSSKYETKYKDMTEKYEHVKTESDEKSSKIAELEAKLQQSSKALESQDLKVKELSDSLKKAQDGVITNGGVQSTERNPLNETQMKQMAEAMKDGESSGSSV